MILAHIFFLVHDLVCVSCQPYSDVQYSIEMVLDGLGGPESAAFPNRAKTNWQFAEEEQSTRLLALYCRRRIKTEEKAKVVAAV